MGIVILTLAIDYVESAVYPLTLMAYDLISKTHSISTGIFPGSVLVPTALRTPMPISLPKTSTNSSLHPSTSRHVLDDLPQDYQCGR